MAFGRKAAELKAGPGQIRFRNWVVAVEVPNRQKSLEMGLSLKIGLHSLPPLEDQEKMALDFGLARLAITVVIHKLQDLEETCETKIWALLDELLLRRAAPYLVGDNMDY